MIEDGTKFLGVDSSVPTPENRSSQANGLSSMVTIEQIAEKVEAINGSTEITDFLTFEISGEAAALRKSNPSIGDKDSYESADGLSLYYDNDSWIFSSEDIPAYTIVSPDDTPPSGTWTDVATEDPVAFATNLIQRTIQENIEYIYERLVEINSRLDALEAV